MKIAVNTRLLLKDKLEGIGWFAYETLSRITKQHPEHQFIFIFDRNFSNEFIFSSNITPVVIYPPTRHPFLWYLWLQYTVPHFLKNQNIDLFLSPDGFIPLELNTKSYNVIHDINFFHKPLDIPFWARKFYNRYFPVFANNASRVGTVSSFSQKDISQNFKIPIEKIDVLYNGANELYKPISAAEKEKTKRKYSKRAEFFLYVGSLHPRKNIARLLKAFDEFKKTISTNQKLILVGENLFKTHKIEEAYKKLFFKDDVIFTGRLPNEELKLLLGSAMALTFVPYFEGFGIPIIEAMYCDTPVITSNVTSMPEVAGEAALLVDPYSIDSIKEAMIRIFMEPELRNNLIAKGQIQRDKFTWQKTADNLWSSVEKCF